MATASALRNAQRDQRTLIDMGYSPELADAIMKSPASSAKLFRDRELSARRIRGSGISKWVVASEIEPSRSTKLPYTEAGYSEAMIEYRQKQYRAIARMHELRALRIDFNRVREKPVYVRRSRRLRIAAQRERELAATRVAKVLQLRPAQPERPTFDCIFGAAA